MAVPSSAPLDTHVPTSRRLAAIWFADLVGYSTLSATDERAALERVRVFQASCDSVVRGHGGRLVKFIGDGAFAEFPSTEAAVEAALALIRDFSARVGEPSRKTMRIGVHVGDVTPHPDGDIYGDGINIAARLQQEASPGSILVSGDVWRQLRSRPIGFRALGKRELKGLGHPIEVFAVVTAESDAEVSPLTPTEFLRDPRRRYALLFPLAYIVAAGVIIRVAIPASSTWTAVIVALMGVPLALLAAWTFGPASATSGRRGRRVAGTGRTSDTARPVPPSADALGAESTPESAERANDGSPHKAAAPVLGQPRLDSLLGRSAELQRVGDLITDGTSRLVTITGPGGVGKTTLATHVAAHHAAHFQDGAVFVPLAGESSSSVLLPKLANRLAIPLRPGADAWSQVIDFLRAKSLLIVLDNFEEMLPSAVALVEILEQAPGIVLLVTSRERLDLKAESVFPLGGLALATDGGLGDAGQLFLESARRIDGTFVLSHEDEAAVRRLCRYLEGIPLAIELAATWTRVLPCKEIVAEVERHYDFLASTRQDVPERHRSLAAVFASSWKMLSEEERRAFRRLSVFEGGFTRSEASEVAGIAFGQVSSLLDRSLLRRAASDRFEMIEVLRQYAAEKLHADPPEAEWVADRHGCFFLERIGATVEDSATDAAATDRVGADLENVRAAWQWAVGRRRLDQLDLALQGLFEMSYDRGRLREGDELLAEAESSLARLKGAEIPLHMRIRIRRSIFQAQMGKLEDAVKLLETGLAEARRAERPEEIALALENLARLALFRGDYPDAKALYTDGLSLYESLGDSRGIGRTLMGLGNVAYNSGEHADAQELYEKSLHLLREVKDHLGLASALCNLGILAATQGDFVTADGLLQESLTMASASHDQRGVATALLNLGVIANLTGDQNRAEEHIQRGIELCRDMGFRRHLPPFMNSLGKIYAESGRPQLAVETYRQALDAAVELREVPIILETMLLGANMVKESDREGAARTASYVAHHPATERSSRESARQLALELGVDSYPISDSEGPEAKAELDQVVRRLLSALISFKNSDAGLPPPLNQPENPS